MINKQQAQWFCKDDISLIENYEQAINDKTQTWHCHHRRETIFSKSELIEIGEYYNRPAIEFIFLTPKEHISLHNKGKKLSEETKRKLSEKNKGEKHPMYGKSHSEETRKKISEKQKGRKLSEETRKKISEVRKGQKISDEHKQRISESKKGKTSNRKGKSHSEESRKKMSEARKLYWEKKKAEK